MLPFCLTEYQKRGIMKVANNRIAYGLLEKAGYSTEKLREIQPKEAWELLKNKGIIKASAKRKLKPKTKEKLRAYLQGLKANRNKLYTEEEYNSFGWARANGIINAGQNKDFTSKFAEALTNPKSIYRKQKTKQGEYMIPVSDIYDKFFDGVNNTIVYAKGTIDKPIITRILQIDEYEETTLAKRRKETYEFERRGIRTKTGGIYRLHTPTNYGFEFYKQRKSKKST